MKKYILILLLAALYLPASAQHKITPDSVLNIANKVAKWQLREWKEHGRKQTQWHWTMGACYAGYMELSQVALHSTYLDDMRAIGNDLKWNTGPNRTMADDYSKTFTGNSSCAKRQSICAK